MNLHNPTVRWGIGLWGGLTIAAVGYLFFEGTTRLILFAIAVADLAITPLILKMATEDQ